MPNADSSSDPSTARFSNRAFGDITAGSAFQRVMERATGSAIQQAMERATGSVFQQAMERAAGSAIQQVMERAAGSAIQQAMERATGSVFQQAMERATQSAGRAHPGELRMDFLNDIAPRLREVVEEIGSNVDEASLEECSEAQPRDVDPVLKVCLHYVAHFGSWARDRFPEYSDRAVAGVNKLAADWLYALLLALPAVLTAAYGPAGFAVGVLLAGGAKFMDEQQQKRLSPANRHGLEVACPTCGALPNMWCIAVKGAALGSPTGTLHRGRLTTSNQPGGE